MLERWIRFAFPPMLPGVWVRGSETGAGAGAAVLAGALAVWAGGSFTPSMAIKTLESSCSGMLPSSEEKGLGGFSRHISQLVLPVVTDRETDAQIRPAICSEKTTQVLIDDLSLLTTNKASQIKILFTLVLKVYHRNFSSHHQYENQLAKTWNVLDIEFVYLSICFCHYLNVVLQHFWLY